MDKLKYRIEHLDNTTTGTCETCNGYNVLTLEKIREEYVYLCSLCRDQFEKEDLEGCLSRFEEFYA